MWLETLLMCVCVCVCVKESMRVWVCMGLEKLLWRWMSLTHHHFIQVQTLTRSQQNPWIDWGAVWDVTVIREWGWFFPVSGSSWKWSVPVPRQTSRWLNSLTDVGTCLIKACVCVYTYSVYILRNFFVVQWLKFCTSNAGSMGSIPGQGGVVGGNICAWVCVCVCVCVCAAFLVAQR